MRIADYTAPTKRYDGTTATRQRAAATAGQAPYRSRRSKTAGARQRAKEERFRAEKRIGCKMQIVKVTRLEEVVE